MMKRILTRGRLPLVGLVAALALGGTSAALGATSSTQKAAPAASTSQFTVTGPYVANPAYTQSFASVSCPSGTTIRGGGIFGTGGTGQSVNSTYPSGNGWAGYMNNTTGTYQQFQVYAVCGYAA
jgi:hypothetical protein